MTARNAKNGMGAVRGSRVATSPNPWFIGGIPRKHSRFEPVNRSSRRKEALNSFGRHRMSLLTSAPTRFMERKNVNQVDTNRCRERAPACSADWQSVVAQIANLRYGGLPVRATPKRRFLGRRRLTSEYLRLSKQCVRLRVHPAFSALQSVRCSYAL